MMTLQFWMIFLRAFYANDNNYLQASLDSFTKKSLKLKWNTQLTFAESNVSESHSVEGSQEVLFALRVHRTLSFRRCWCSCCGCVGASLVCGARACIVVGILNVDGRLDGRALLTVHRLHNRTRWRGYARRITVDDVVGIHGNDLRRIRRLVLKLNGCLWLNCRVVIGIWIAGTAMTWTMIGAEWEIIISAALSVVRLLSTLMMMMMRVMYAAAVLDRTWWKSGRRRCQSKAWIICIDNSPLPTWRKREREKKEREYKKMRKNLSALRLLSKINFHFKNKFKIFFFFLYSNL